MKKYQIIFALMGLFSLALMAFAITLLAPIGVILSTSTVIAGTDTPVTVEAVSDTGVLNKTTIDQLITRIEPGRTPLDQILRTIGSKPTKSFKHEYYSVESRPITDTVTSQYSHTSPGATSATIYVDNPDIWKIDDTFMVVLASYSGKTTDSTPLMGIVSAVDRSSNYITATCLNGTDGWPTIPAASVLVIAGAAKNESDAMTDAFAMLPYKEYNYCQIHMAQAEESLYQRIHEKEVAFDFTDYEEENLKDMRRRAEITALVGFRKQIDFTSHNRTNERYLSGGATYFISKSKSYDSSKAVNAADADAFNKPLLTEWWRSLFTGNNGSEGRICFMGSKFAANMHLINDFQKQIDGKNPVTKFGVTFKEYETNFGIVYFKTHYLFDYLGWEYDALIIDPANIEKRQFKAVEITELDLKKAGIRNVNASVITEAWCPVFKNPDTHMWIRG